MVKLLKGRYELFEVVGQGGQGRVVRAFDQRLERQVALKVRAVRSADERKALIEEARILVSLKPHSALPIVRDEFSVGNRHYMLMDWIEGQGLDRVLRERGDPGLPAFTVLRYLTQVADALDYLHAHDPPVVHQDVKPANMILTPEGGVVLVDFGIAGRKGEEGRQTAGTRGYAAPELATGGSPAPASDIYSLAATAVALLTGAPPERTTVLPKAAEGAIRRALTTEPSRRPATAGEFADDLRAALEAASSAEREEAERRRAAPGEQISLMLVDDHPMWRETLRKLLERDGFGVILAEAADGAEAVDVAASASPDVVIMDMHLPGMSGVEATRRLVERDPNIKVLVLSSSDERSDVLDALKAGASGYLLKTAGAAEVTDAVRRVHDGEAVFPAALASVVLGEFRRMGGRGASRPARRKAQRPRS